MKGKITSNCAVTALRDVALCDQQRLSLSLRVNDNPRFHSILVLTYSESSGDLFFLFSVPRICWVSTAIPTMKERKSDLNPLI